MAFARPTLTQLRDGALQDITAAQITDTATGAVVNPLLLQFDPLTILAKVMAGLAYAEYGYLDYISLQATPFTATDETALGWGALVGVGLKPAQPAIATVSWQGVAGRDFPAGTQVTRGDGVTYATVADVVIPASGTGILTVQATTTGATTTIAAGATLELSSPIEGINDAGTVTGSVQPGTDIETQDDFRARYLAKFAAPPQGGSSNDFLGWAEAVPGVTRAWVLANVNGPGSVGVYVMFDTSEAGDGGFPQGSNGVSPLDNDGAPRDPFQIATGDQATVANALIPLQPVTPLVYVLAPIPQPIDFAIANLGAANTEANQAAITAALAEVLYNLGDPRGCTIYPSAWTSAIASVATVFTVQAPLVPEVLPTGFLPVVGTVTFSS